jgi:hypothetical protein
MQNRKTTKKAAAVKRKLVTPKSQNVADFRATLRTAIAPSPRWICSSTR